MKHCQMYVNTLSKIQRHLQHVAFNTGCRRYSLVPRSLRVKPLVDTEGGQRIARKASTQFLSARIDNNYQSIRRYAIYSTEGSADRHSTPTGTGIVGVPTWICV